jgi:hypothetical protein
VLLAGSGALANVDGQMVAIGERIEGHRLVSVSEHQAVFEKDGRRIVLDTRRPLETRRDPLPLRRRPAGPRRPRHPPPPAAGADPAAPRRITMTLRDVPVGDVFEMLSRNEKINVLVGKGVTGNVSVNLYNVTADEAVRTVAEAAGYVAELRGDTFLVVERKDAGLDGLSGNTLLRTFKVQYSDPKTVAVILTKHISRYGKITPLPSAT